MGYQIQYDKKLNMKYPIYNTKTKMNVVFTIIVAAFAFIIACQPTREWVLRWLLPANIESTTKAFSRMVTEVGEGAAVSDAVTAFCKEVLADG